MRKILMAMLAVVFTAGAAHAQITRLPTQTLDAGKVEVEAGIEYEYSKLDIVGDSANLKREILLSEISTEFGVARGVQFSLKVPYFWEDMIKITDGTASVRRDGLGDVTVGTLLSTGSRNTRLFSLGLDVKLDTAPVGEGGTGTTDFIPIVGASTKRGNLTPYATYAVVIRNHQEGDTHELTFGTEIDATRNLIFDTRLVAQFHDSGVFGFSSHQRYRLDVTAYRETIPGLFILPGISVFFDTSARIPGEGLEADDGFGFGASLTLHWEN